MSQVRALNLTLGGVIGARGIFLYNIEDTRPLGSREPGSHPASTASWLCLWTYHMPSESQGHIYKMRIILSPSKVNGRKC